jgi:phospholipase C
MVSHKHYDHASVPSTLRALFAPDAPALTCRDRYSPSFHDLLTLDRPRADLPSLARWVADQPSATGPSTATSGTPDGYDFFLEQSELMRREMLMVQEPEFADVDVIDDVQSADVARRAFLDAAERHRAESILSGLR